MAPIPTEYSTKNSNSVVKKANERWTMGKETSLSPSHCPPRFLFVSLQPSTTQRERADIQTINYHSRLRHYTVMVLNCTKVCVSFGCFSFICSSFLLFSGWLYSYKRNLLSVLQKTAVLTNPINYVKYILKNYYLVTVNKNRFARVTITLHVS